MLIKQITKLLKKNSPFFFFLITLLYFLYTYVSIFLYFFNNAFYYLFINIFIFYYIFHFIIRALVYPGSISLFCKRTNYDNRIEFSKFYIRECLKLLHIIDDIKTEINLIINETKCNDIKITFNEIFSEKRDDNYFKIFNNIYVFYTLYVSYYFYINLEENVKLSNEQLTFYYYLKNFMININNINIYINKDDILDLEEINIINIREDYNIRVKKFFEEKKKINIKKNSFEDFNSFSDNFKDKNELCKINENFETNDYYIINFLSLFSYENYEKSITHSNYRNFYIQLKKPKNLINILNGLIFYLKKINEILKINTNKEKCELRNLTNFVRDFFKTHIVGTLELFKYELIYKYYAKQEYIYINKTKIDCMFIPCKDFLNEKMKEYKNNYKNKRNQFNSNQEIIFYNVFNNHFYNYIYQDDYLCDKPVVLCFNPNAAYYELNACCSSTVEFYLQKNINVFLYNYRGYNQSKGYPTLYRNNEDALNLSKYILSKKVKFLGLNGRSIGGPLCFYVSYYLNNLNENKLNLIYEIEKNEHYIKRCNKEINKSLKIFNKDKTKKKTKKKFFLYRYLLYLKNVINLFFQFIKLYKLKITNKKIKKNHIFNTVDNINTLYDDSLNNIKYNKSKISFICVDKSFSNFEKVAKYLLGEYVYNILQFTSYKLDITKYYINSNVPKLIIYDNNDEIIHYLSNVITGVSNEICKIYKNVKRKEGNNNLFNIKSDNINNKELLPLIIKENNINDLNNIESDKKNINTNILSEKYIYNDILIIDEYVDESWINNKLKKIDLNIFLQSWKVLIDYSLFLNKGIGKNNSFISLILETYNSLKFLFNSKESKLEQETNNALKCIYNSHSNFIDNFKFNNYDYEHLINEYMDNTNSDEKNIYEFLNQDENYKYLIKKLDKILNEIYMSKRKEIEKIYFTYRGFFLMNNFLHEYLKEDIQNNQKGIFQMNDTDLIHFLSEFKSSINQILNAINNQLNSGGQLFSEINNISEKEKTNFLKSFIKRMKVFGSYPSQCFNTYNNDEFVNSLHHIPFILSHYCENEKDKNNNELDIENKNNYFNNESDSNNSSDENISKKCEQEKERITIKEVFELNNNFYNEDNLLKPYVTIHKSLLLHDLIICLNLYKENNSCSNIFYKLDKDIYLIDLKELLIFLKKQRTTSSNFIKSIDIFANDIGIDIKNYDKLSQEFDKYVSWLRLNNRMVICKIYLLIENELNKIKKYTKKIYADYISINENTNIQFIIFLIYRILIFKKLITHLYIIYLFFHCINKSLDININQDELITLADLNPLIQIKSFNIFYKGLYKIYSPKILGYPLVVNSGHNGNLSKEELNFVSMCFNSFLKP